MSGIEKLRKKVALGIAVIILLALVFSVTSYENVIKLNDDVAKMEETKYQAMEDFLNLSLAIDNGTLDLLENKWYDLKLRYEGEELVSNFLREVDNVSEQMFLSIIVTLDGEMIYFNYQMNEYNELIKQIEEAIKINPNSRKLIINENGEEVFGEGERIFLQRRSFYGGGKMLRIYVGFEEKIRVLDFISTADVETLNSIKNNAESSITNIKMFTYVLTLYGIALMAMFRKFMVDILIDIAKTKGIDMNEDKLIGEIAVDNGFITKDQLKKCISMQVQQRKQNSKV